MSENVASNQGKEKLWYKGDLNGFFGLFSNVLTNFLAAIGLLVAIGMPDEYISGLVIPGTTLAVGLGGIFLAIQAKRLSDKTGRNDVTAMPYGLSVPHYFQVAFSVILVVYIATGDWETALATGIAWNLIQGVIMTAGAFVGPFIRAHLPRTAMLGALAGMAMTWIAMVPFGQVFQAPYIGLTSFAIVIAGWFAHKKLPFNMPAGALAMIIGTILAWLTGYMDPSGVSSAFSGIGLAIPGIGVGFWAKGLAQMAPFLPSAIPLAIYDFLESLDNLESAAAAGEEYPVARAMLVPGLLTVLGAALGSPFPTIIYIGHPGWKAAGARIGYSWLTGVCVLVLGFTGLLNVVLNVIPLVALLPILVYIGMTIMTQAITVSDPKHYPAIAAGFFPLIGGFCYSKVSSALGAVGAEIDYALMDANGIPLLGWFRLSKGDILIGMLLGAMVYYILEKNYLHSAYYALVTAALSFVGLILSPELGIGAGWEVSVGFLCFAAVMIGFHFYHPEENVNEEAASQ